MRNDIIKVNDPSYARYESLLLRRDAVRKEAFECEQEFIRMFGELILKVFEKKIECIRKKKMIEFCTFYINRGEAVDQAALQEYLRREMAEYEQTLKNMIAEHEAAQRSTVITQATLLKIKRIYHRMVKKIHPDINPLTECNEEMSTLWRRLSVAYECNNLREMEECEFLINALLEKLGNDAGQITIPDIEERIAQLEQEIADITAKDPYQYKYLLASDTDVAQKKEELAAELQEYTEYSDSLEQILSDSIKGRMKITWRMN